MASFPRFRKISRIGKVAATGGLLATVILYGDRLEDLATTLRSGYLYARRDQLEVRRVNARQARQEVAIEGRYSEALWYQGEFERLTRALAEYPADRSRTIFGDPSEFTSEHGAILVRLGVRVDDPVDPLAALRGNGWRFGEVTHWDREHHVNRWIVFGGRGRDVIGLVNTSREGAWRDVLKYACKHTYGFTHMYDPLDAQER